MSLVIRININDGPTIAMVTAQRLSTTRESASEDVNDYLVTRYDAIDDGFKLATDLVIQHRYGDGAVALAYLALKNVQ